MNFESRDFDPQLLSSFFLGHGDQSKSNSNNIIQQACKTMVKIKRAILREDVKVITLYSLILSIANIVKHRLQDCI